MNMILRMNWRPRLVALLLLCSLAGAPAKVLAASDVPAIDDGQVRLQDAINKQQMFDALELSLSPEEERYLDQRRFLLVPMERTKFKQVEMGDYEFDEMLIIHDRLNGPREPYQRKPEHARLITPDLALHAFHKYFANCLEYMEEKELLPILTRFLESARRDFLKHRDTATGELEARYDRLAAQATTALVLARLGQGASDQAQQDDAMAGLEFLNDDSDTAEAAASLAQELGKPLSKENRMALEQELGLIMANEAVEATPLFKIYSPGLSRHDYTQYTVRGHYTARPTLRAYFRAMMFLGRHGYRLGEAAGMGDAILWACLLQDNPALQKDYELLLDITGLFAGQPDDLQYQDFRQFVLTTLGAKKLSPSMAADAAALQKLLDAVPTMPMPKIISGVFIDKQVAEEEKEQLRERLREFRVFGQRFAWDAYIYEQLLGGQGTQNPWKPTTASTLMVPAALGHPQALEYLGKLIEARDGRTPEEAQSYLGLVKNLQRELEQVPQEQWRTSIATAWMGLLREVLTPAGPGYPAYMRNEAFPIKQLQTFLGSYTEVKHDTILYAKQQYAEMGDGENMLPPPPVPKGFVEPNLPFWQGLLDLLDSMQNAFKTHGIMEKETDQWGILSQFRNQVAFVHEFAVLELFGRPISNDMYERLRVLGWNHLARPLVEVFNLQEDAKKSALIADVQTDAVTQKIVYTATGRPEIMLALVGNDGTARLTVGLAFNHYEFTGPLAGPRFTDADWRFKVYDFPESLPPKNGWYEAIITGAAAQ